MNAQALMKSNVDGFAGYESRTEGGDQQQASNVIQGSVVKFTNEANWVTRDGMELSPDLELVAIDVTRVVQKWKDQVPVETRRLEPGEKFPDLDQLNADTPRSEWGKGPDGQPRGPWQNQHILYLLDPATLDQFSYPTGTVGGAAAIGELVKKIKIMRNFKGPHVYPVVCLSDKLMQTKFGGRQRPHFLIKRWVPMGNGSEEHVLLPAPTRPSLAPGQTAAPENSADESAAAPANAAAPVEPTAAAKPATKMRTTKRGITRIDTTVVAEPTLREELNDSLGLTVLSVFAASRSTHGL
jgi:hypothetical protein